MLGQERVHTARRRPDAPPTPPCPTTPDQNPNDPAPTNYRSNPITTGGEPARRIIQRSPSRCGGPGPPRSRTPGRGRGCAGPGRSGGWCAGRRGPSRPARPPAARPRRGRSVANACRSECGDSVAHAGMPACRGQPAHQPEHRVPVEPGAGGGDEQRTVGRVAPRAARYASTAAAVPGVSARRRGLPPLPTNRTLRCPRSYAEVATSRQTSSPTRRPEVGQQRDRRPGCGPPAGRSSASAAASSASTSSGRQARRWPEWSRSTRGRSAPATGLASHRVELDAGSRTSWTARTACGRPWRGSGGARSAPPASRAYALTSRKRRPQRVEVAGRAPGQPAGDVPPVRGAGVLGQPPVASHASVKSIAAWPVTRAAVGRGARSVTAVRLPARAAPGTQARRSPLYNDVLNVVDPWI